MSVIFKSGASNNKRKKIVPFPDNVLIIPKRSPPRVYPPPHVPEVEDLEKLIPIEFCSDEEWTIETINSAQRSSCANDCHKLWPGSPYLRP